MNSDSPIGFGDNVRVRETPETIELGLAGRLGQVFGETTPSVTSVTVIGSTDHDYAINVNFDDVLGEYWFAADQLELMDHAPGTEIRLAGVDMSWVRREDGGWDEVAGASAQVHRKPWWKFW